MRQTSYEDSDGRLWAVELPDGAPESDAPLGFPIGPVPLRDLGLPLDIEVRLHNQLFHRRMFTVQDVQTRRQEVFGALQAALATDCDRIVTLYLTGPSEPAPVPSENGSEPKPRARSHA